MLDIPQSIFRTYDIRGIVGKTLTPDIVYTIGLSIGSEAQDRGQNKIIIGRDGRLSGPELLAALADGIKETGCDVINIGEVPTPTLYYATNVLDTKSGVMLTGSHNPPDYNGIKIVIDGITFCEDDIQNLYHRIKANNFHSGRGSEQRFDIIEQYIERIVSDVKLERVLKVVIDCGNGVGGKVAPTLFKKLGCDVIELFCEVDGTFPNHHPDPLIPENLQDVIAAVKTQQADIGLAFDGDADRLGVVNNQGEIIWADRQLILFVRDILPRHPGARIPFDVKCTQHLAKEIEKLHGIPEMSRTGHALLKAKVKELNAPIGGELSGHMFFRERWYGFDDGLYAGARLLEILAKDPRSSSEIFADIPDSINTPELKMGMPEEEKYKFMEKFIREAKFPEAQITTIDGIRVDFPDGFGLVRPSNTTPYIILRFEGHTKEALERIKEIFREQLLALDKHLELPF
jgi:phosphomannomutase/phosphoglucomutase